MGWTGIQYSMFRVALALSVARVCWVRLEQVEGPAWPLLAVGLVGAFALALGWRDRAVAANLLALLVFVAGIVDGAPLVLPQADVILTGSLLVLHLFVPITPFGSWDARNRIDPRGGWHRPAWIGHVAWLWLAIIQLSSTASVFGLPVLGVASHATSSDVFPLFALARAIIVLAFVVALFVPRWRAGAWIALTLTEIGRMAAFGPSTGDGALLLLHLFAADPAWWPGRRLRALGPLGDFEANSPSARLFYDGDCGFCHRAVRIVLSEDEHVDPLLTLRFAPLAGESFTRLVAAHDEIDPESLPDSIIVILEDGQLLTRSTAALEIASRLGGAWRGLALVASLLPTSLLDAAYDAIARVRKRLAPEPDGACPILPAEMRARFDP